MAPDDRDRNFEKALARHLRSSASPRMDANASRESCPDVETLAAYHDGSLAAEERDLWKQHVVGCENCQLVLAHLETPLEIPVNLAGIDSVLPSQRPASSAAAVSPVVIARPPRRTPSLRWLWLVPAGAAAAGLIAWISLNQQKPAQLTQTNPVEVAENRQAPVPAQGPAPAATRVAPPERKEKDQPDANAVSGLTSGASTARDSESKPANGELQLAQQAPKRSPASGTHGPSLSMQAQQQQQLNSRTAPGGVGGALLDRKRLDAPASASPQEPSKEAAAPASASPPAGEPSFLANESVKAPAPKPGPEAPAPASASAGTGAATKSGVTNTDAVSSMSETVEVTSEAPALKKVRAALLQDPHVFSAPDKKHLWRVGPAGWIEFSKDKGVKWTAQLSGVSADLIAGSAPDAKISWIVGRSAIILRTTDAGDHWTRLNSPEPGDLAGIIATDALHAKIWFAPDPQTGVSRTFETSDGGAAWTASPN